MNRIINILTGEEKGESYKFMSWDIVVSRIEEKTGFTVKSEGPDAKSTQSSNVIFNTQLNKENMIQSSQTGSEKSAKSIASWVDYS